MLLGIVSTKRGYPGSEQQDGGHCRWQTDSDAFGQYGHGIWSTLEYYPYVHCSYRI
jgi:hypothetical protein